MTDDSLRHVTVAIIFSLFFLTSLLTPLYANAEPLLELSPVTHDLTPLSQKSAVLSEVIQDKITISGKTDPSAQVFVKKITYDSFSEGSVPVSSDGSFNTKVTLEVGPGFTQGVEKGEVRLSVAAIKGLSAKEIQVPLANSTSSAAAPQLVGAALNAGVAGYPHTFVAYNNPWFFYTGQYVNDEGTAVQTSKDDAATQLAKFGAVSLHYTDDASSVALIKQKNPTTKVFAYINPMFCYKSIDSNSEYQQVVKFHPEWFLYPDAASRQAQTNPIAVYNGSEQVMDLTTGWRDEVIKLSKEALAKGFDGLYVDCICDDPSLCYGYGSNTAPSGDWHAALNTYLDQVRVAGKLNFYNGQCPAVAPSSQDFLDRTDGWMDEGFISYKGWKTSAVDMPQYAASKNKFTIFYATNPDIDTRHFYFTSALLSDGYFFYSSANTQWFSDYGGYCGDPLGQAYHVSGLNGVWARDYTGAKVIVNPTSSNVTVSASGYTDFSGKTLASVTIGPNDGVIIKKPRPIASAPAISVQDANSLDVFVKGTDNALWWRHWTAARGWSWKSLGGYVTSDPAAVSRGAGVIDVFVRGGDGALWTRSTTNGGTSWSSWTSLGGGILLNTGPAASARTSGYDVFVTGMNHALYQKTVTSSGTVEWRSLGGYLTSSPAAASRGAGMIDVFVRGSNGVLYQRSTSNGGSSWNAWQKLDGLLADGTAPAVAARAGGYDVFVTGMNHALYQKTWQNGGWSGWTSLSGYLTSSPAATSRSSDSLDVFARGNDGYLWQKSWSRSGWSSWTWVGGL